MNPPIPPDLDQRIADLAKGIEQKQARLDRLKARKSTRSRSIAVRRQILVGVTVLNKAGEDKLFHGVLMSWLDAELKNNRDRALFDLPPLDPLRSGQFIGANQEDNQLPGGKEKMP